MELDLQRLDALMARMQTLGITELDYRNGAEHLRLVRGVGTVASAPVAQPSSSGQATASMSAPAGAVQLHTLVTAPEQAAPATETIEAPMHGQFYASPAPDAPPFVQVGDTVKEGQALYILEVMKTLSRIEAEYPCRIVEILAQNAQPLEPGTPLFRVERLDA
ncbi:acetyl-CoA carboxylase, biotin carboxyl carrier protein [Gluconobacter oxydans]|uniref:acetyl-CoA carboxylase biotin carboxyl carrier protein n=1 Tax=Gluconobacter thailandicus TaxID=257438 RepID=UPI0002997CDD|nr:acetyl-CoA carboxylase biotin carboxyl carrier protein [Gluconobacter thailandicus]AFW02594.1 biotin carboxyl carrier protein of acetyl-CoA carboxylase [Gluconobacter oxydans H24]ANQ41921.1 acetyl-CoA carboxylase, biotin carboxyl carrier protein [Gluconobacter oxydans]